MGRHSGYSVTDRIKVTPPAIAQCAAIFTLFYVLLLGERILLASEKERTALMPLQFGELTHFGAAF